MQLEMQLPFNSYSIYIGAGLLTHKNLLCRHILSEQILIVTNQTIAPLYLNQIKQIFSAHQVDTLVLKDGEAYKTQTSLFEIYDALLRNQHSRDTTLIALGGGVIGDLVGFAAATFHRGVRYIQLPTTLLAQVDASIGGKTAINYGEFKNAIGAFYQPYAVMIDVNVLQTLTCREFNAGFAEIIKYALLVGGDFFSYLSALMEENLQNNPQRLIQLIYWSCKIKSQFVMEDEFEADHRALLNLGHTFGHALESITHYQQWLHGEAVAIGLYCAALLSYHIGHLSWAEVNMIDAMLARVDLPRRIPRTIDLEKLMTLMMQDKKVKNKQLRFVVMKNIGHCYLENQVTSSVLHQVLLCAVEGENNEKRNQPHRDA